MNVSRETQHKLDIFTDLAFKWNEKINLFSRSTKDNFAQRHIADSVQLFDHAPNFLHWVDLGSGGGFPGLPVAICALERHPEARFTLVESDQRKSAFLREVARVLGLPVSVVTKRIEAIPSLQADILSARALAPLDKLIEFTVLHRKQEGIALFPKGVSHAKEIADAREKWHFDVKVHPSRTEDQSVILELGDISHV